MRQGWIIAACVLATGCGPEPAPPRNVAFEGLPVTGSRAFAERLGFTPCFETSNALRCRKEGVTLFGEGPYRGAVDLAGGGAQGFSQVTLWHDTDQYAVNRVDDRLKARGWRLCRTGQEDRGDQEVWTKPGAPVRISIDISYWGKRRLRVLPEQGQPTGHCW